MDAAFWHDRWSNGQIGFHEPTGNDLLLAHFDSLGLSPGARVLVPLCGKTRDIGWLLSKGCHVIGVELSRAAIDQLFEDLDVAPDAQETAEFHHYQAPMLDIFVGDVFALTPDHIGQIDAVYDRAALVALPPEMRARYAAHLQEISEQAPQLLICFAYDQTQVKGPPFSVDTENLTQLHGDTYTITELASRDANIKGTPAVETAWHLVPKA